MSQNLLLIIANQQKIIADLTKENNRLNFKYAKKIITEAEIEQTRLNNIQKMDIFFTDFFENYLQKSDDETTHINTIYSFCRQTYKHTNGQFLNLSFKEFKNKLIESNFFNYNKDLFFCKCKDSYFC